MIILTDPKYLDKEEIERIINNPLNEEEILICKRHHLLTNARDDIITGSKEPGSVYFTTHKGEEILDCTAQAWALNLGHSNPDITYAISLQAQKTAHTTSFFLTPARVKLANKITTRKSRLSTDNYR